MAGPTVVVAEDDATIRALVAELLAEEGYAVAVAADGAEALAVLGAVRPALLVLDLRLPHLDGPAVLAALRAGGVAVPVLVLTAAVGALEPPLPGVAAVLHKPFSLDDLLAAVARLAGPPGG